MYPRCVLKNEWEGNEEKDGKLNVKLDDGIDAPEK